MSKSIEALVEDYDRRGAISRRTFVQALAVVTASSGVSEATAATFRANSLNHVTLAVTDPEVSRKFYEETLGVNVVSRQSNGINMGLGDSFLGLYSIPEPGRIHHFCVGFDGYVIEDGAEKLRLVAVATAAPRVLHPGRHPPTTPEARAVAPASNPMCAKTGRSSTSTTRMACSYSFPRKSIAANGAIHW